MDVKAFHYTQIIITLFAIFNLSYLTLFLLCCKYLVHILVVLGTGFLFECGVSLISLFEIVYTKVVSSACSSAFFPVSHECGRFSDSLRIFILHKPSDQCNATIFFMYHQFLIWVADLQDNFLCFHDIEKRAPCFQSNMKRVAVLGRLCGG